MAHFAGGPTEAIRSFRRLFELGLASCQPNYTKQTSHRMGERLKVRFFHVRIRGYCGNDESAALLPLALNVGGAHLRASRRGFLSACRLLQTFTNSAPAQMGP